MPPFFFVMITKLLGYRHLNAHTSLPDLVPYMILRLLKSESASAVDVGSQPRNHKKR